MGKLDRSQIMELYLKATDQWNKFVAFEQVLYNNDLGKMDD